MLQHIGDVLPRYYVYQELFSDHQQLQDALCEVYSEIISFICHAQRFFSQPSTTVLAKSIWKTFDEEFERSRNQLRRCSEKIEDDANLVLKAEVFQMRVELCELKFLIKSREEREQSELAGLLLNLMYGLLMDDST